MHVLGNLRRLHPRIGTNDIDVTGAKTGTYRRQGLKGEMCKQGRILAPGIGDHPRARVTVEILLDDTFTKPVSPFPSGLRL
jgi:hypothetical protein